MPKNFLKKYLPSPSEFKKNKSLHFLGDHLYAQNLWHLNRKSVSRAVFIGIFASFIPMPLQMVLAAILAIFFGANLPLSVALVWISNPLTWVPIFYSTYKLGAWILNVQPQNEFTIDLSIEWALNQLVEIWQPLFLGSLLSGLFFAILGYVIIKLLWRLHIVRHWKKRKIRNHR